MRLRESREINVVHRSATESRSEPSVRRLSIIIDLLYGFAIGNGLSDAIKGVVLNFDELSLALLFLGIVMAFTEWLAYHVHVSHIQYRGITRLLMDMAFPIMIYLILLAPSLASHVWNAAYIGSVLLVYFVGALIYVRVLKRESPDHTPNFAKVGVVCTILSAGAASLGWAAVALGRNAASAQNASWTAVSADLLAMAAIGLWALFTIRCLRETMDPPEQ